MLIPKSQNHRQNELQQLEVSNITANFKVTHGYSHSLRNSMVSVHPISLLQQCTAGLLLWAQWVRDIDQLLHSRCHSSMAHNSKCGKCHIFRVYR